MGPSIILDKSALQSLSQRSLNELGRYFYTNITPTLLHEILADLSLKKSGPALARAKVAEIAKKVIPFDAITNAPFHLLCFGELVGLKVQMQRRPIVAGGQTVTTTEGKSGIYVGVQAENEAVNRWRAGVFSQSDLDFAIAWRETIDGMRLESMKRSVPKTMNRIDSLPMLAIFVDQMLAHPESQPDMLNWLMDFLVLCESDREVVRTRWRGVPAPVLKSMAPYCHYCLRIMLIFLMGMHHGLFGTRNSNLVDIEYLYYMPFAYVFCSGDKFLADMASLVLDPDQSFVARGELRAALDDLALRRKEAEEKGGRDEANEVQPTDDSLVRKLWIKHWGRFVPEGRPEIITPERSVAIMREARAIMDAIHEATRKRPPNQRFPRAF